MKRRPAMLALTVLLPLLSAMPAEADPVTGSPTGEAPPPPATPSAFIAPAPAGWPTGQPVPPGARFPRATVSGLLFSDLRQPVGYVPTVTGQSHPLSSFNITRAFLGGEARFNDTWSGTLMVNAYPETFVAAPGATSATTESNNVVLQYAYLQGTGLLPDNTVQFGMVAAPMPEYESFAWGYRMLGNLALTGGIAGNDLGGSKALMAFYDKGVRTWGSLGSISYDGAILNGEGFRANETDGGKNFQGRLTWTALPGLDLSLLGSNNNLSTGQANRLMGFARYAMGDFRIGASGTGTWDSTTGSTTTTNGAVISGFAVVPLPIPMLPSPALLARADQFFPDLSQTGGVNDQRLETIVGLSIKPSKYVTLVLDDQNVNRYNSAASQVNYNLIALHSSVAF